MDEMFISSLTAMCGAVVFFAALIVGLSWIASRTRGRK